MKKDTTDRLIPVDMLLEAYCQGYFPMASSATGKIAWYSSNPRGIIDLNRFHVPARLKRTLRKHPFEIKVDTAFSEVIQGCADRRSTWISTTLRESYERLHKAGFAHSVEAWRDGRLEGGLYGVAIRGAFFGESMFHRAPDASKAALIALVDRLCLQGFVLLDTQMVTPLTAQFGAEKISEEEYQYRLAQALAADCEF